MNVFMIVDVARPWPWELQHSRALALFELRYQNDLAVRKLQRIVVDVALIWVEASKSREPVAQQAKSEAWQKPRERMVRLDLAFKGELGARKQAHRHVWFLRSREATGVGPRKSARNEPVTDLGGACRDDMKAIIAHPRSPFAWYDA
jgi:hypothetical protein